ncbi:hypothetical protein AB4099_25365 [Bosea sp. 2KB_26]|uniref:hypothetical protein n=1 Tax=Bosea sp. 2KB_26 TaxID=3237475 RepID=UPI003F8E7409
MARVRSRQQIPRIRRRARAEHGAMIAALDAGDRAGRVQLCRDHPGPSRVASIAAVEQRQGRDQAR